MNSAPEIKCVQEQLNKKDSYGLYKGIALPIACGVLVAVTPHNYRTVDYAQFPVGWHYGDFIGVETKLVNFPAIGRMDNITSSTEALAKEFNELADRWENETAVHSSPGSTYLHKDYISIMAKGTMNKETIVPLILKRLPNSGSDYFFALQYIAGGNPARDAKDFAGAIKAWRDWANQNGFKDEALAS